MSGGGAVDAAPMRPLVLLAAFVAAANFAVVAYVDLGLVAGLALMFVLVLWRAVLALMALDRALPALRIDRGTARARFLKVPVGAAIACLVLGLGTPEFAHWTGIDGAVMSLKGRRTIEHASDPALFWFASACWYLVSAGLLWFGFVFAWMVERVRRDPRRFSEVPGPR